jgi:hypothetical protein
LENDVVVPAGPVADRVAVRFVTPETGGVARPRFLTERELALYARLEAMMEQMPVPDTEYPERYVRTALDRLVARAMLASLLLQRGQEPPDLPRLTQEVRVDLADRVGGAEALEQLMKREGIDDDELSALLRDQARATYYVDKAVTPIKTVTEDSLREAFRGASHPYRGLKYEEARPQLKRWVVAERMRASELEFLQSARSRITIAAVRPVGVATTREPQLAPMPSDTTIPGTPGRGGAPSLR